MQNILLSQATLKEAKRWQLMSMFLIIIILLLISAIVTILPLKETRIKYVEFAKAGSYHFKIIESPLRKEQKLLLIRQTLRDYVLNRISYTGNVRIDTPSVQKVVAMSSVKVINQFRHVYERIDQETSIQRREVEIISDIPLSKNVHQVHYRTIDYHDKKTYESQWVATISYQFSKQIVNSQNELLNPLGIVVDGFIEAKKKLTQEDLNEIL